MNMKTPISSFRQKKFHIMKKLSGARSIRHILLLMMLLCGIDQAAFAQLRESREKFALLLGQLSSGGEVNGVSVAAATNDAVYDLVMEVASTNSTIDGIAARLAQLHHRD